MFCFVFFANLFFSTPFQRVHSEAPKNEPNRLEIITGHESRFFPRVERC